MLNTELRNKLIELFQTKNGQIKNELAQNELAQNELAQNELAQNELAQNELAQNEITFVNPYKPLDEFTIRQIKNEIEVIVPLTKFQYKKIFTNNETIIAYLNLHLQN